MSPSVSQMYFSKEHVWLRLSGDTCRLGITDYAQDQTGEIIYADLPEEGQEARAGEAIMEIESSKVVAEVASPVNGVITEINSALEDTPEIINQSPYGDGWLVGLSLADPGELQGLMSQEEYEALVD